MVTDPDSVSAILTLDLSDVRQIAMIVRPLREIEQPSQLTKNTTIRYPIHISPKGLVNDNIHLVEAFLHFYSLIELRQKSVCADVVSQICFLESFQHPHVLNRFKNSILQQILPFLKNFCYGFLQ